MALGSGFGGHCDGLPRQGETCLLEVVIDYEITGHVVDNVVTVTSPCHVLIGTVHDFVSNYAYNLFLFQTQYKGRMIEKMFSINSHCIDEFLVLHFHKL